MIDSPWERTSRMSSSTVADSTAPSAAEGSSISRIRQAASNATAREMATIWRWPPESTPTGSLVESILMLSRSSSSAASRCMRRRSRNPSRLGSPLVGSRPMNTLAATSRLSNRARSW